MNHSSLPALPCMCGSFRRTSRALTQFYDQALRPTGLRPTQLTILQVLQRAGEVSQGQLGEMLAMDSTTLTRTLRIMRQRNWIAEHRGDDRRERRLRLAKAGVAQLKVALPVWEETQSRLRRKLGVRDWQELMRLANEATDLVTGLTAQGDLS